MSLKNDSPYFKLFIQIRVIKLVGLKKLFLVDDIGGVNNPIKQFKEKLILFPFNK